MLLRVVLVDRDVHGDVPRHPPGTGSSLSGKNGVKKPATGVGDAATRSRQAGASSRSTLTASLTFPYAWRRVIGPSMWPATAAWSTAVPVTSTARDCAASSCPSSSASTAAHQEPALRQQPRVVDVGQGRPAVLRDLGASRDQHRDPLIPARRGEQLRHDAGPGHLGRVPLPATGS